MNEGPAPPAGTPWRIRLIALGIVLAVLVVFIARNATTVEIEFVVFEVRTRIAWALLLSSLLGFVLGALLMRLRR
jgi:uncharacterized integral membrane protein